MHCLAFNGQTLTIRGVTGLRIDSILFGTGKIMLLKAARRNEASIRGIWNAVDSAFSARNDSMLYVTKSI